MVLEVHHVSSDATVYPSSPPPSHLKHLAVMKSLNTAWTVGLYKLIRVVRIYSWILSTILEVLQREIYFLKCVY